ncbi:MAG TPA: carboxypeptidase regulatory-like domain-containing protein [Pyrinomonadaceae bacterium]|nr:carboxypeptidase regulatory-like domain-containing protein [Pyrinomonadaceae bacterium]
MTKTTRLVFHILGGLLLLTMSTVTGFAQTSGEISGLVTDPSGAAVSGASVTVSNKATGATRNVTTNNDGLYSFPSLRPGIYELKVEQSGFKTVRLDNVKIEVQQTARLDVSLEVGQVDEMVTINSSAALLNSENTTLGTVIENKIVTELPLNGRQYLNLVALSPNVNVLAPAAGQAGARQGGERAQQAISAGGQRIFFDYYTLDGVNNMDVNFNTYVALPSIDAIQEFKVQIGVYPAEYGHQSTQVNVLTKSGGNTFHGSAFEFHRNDALDAKQYQFTSAKPKNPFKWNDYGYEVDGPVRIPRLFNGKDKLFFMSNYEALRRRQSVLNTFTVPTAKMFAGDFSELLPSTKIYDPNTGLPFQGNVIPTTRLDPISLKFLKYYNSANVLGTNNFAQTSNQPFDRDAFVVRIDYVESSKSQWMGRYNWGDEKTSTQGLNLAGTKVLTHYKQYAVANTRSLRPELVSEARFGYTTFFNSLGTLSAGTNDVVSEIGIPNQNPGAPITWGIPNVVFNGGGFTAIGDANDGPFANDNNTMQLVEKLSWIHGTHTFAFGAEYSRQNFNQVGNQFSRGVFTFQANATKDPVTGGGGYAFAEFLLGKLFVSTNAAAVADARFKRDVFHTFIDDTWKVSPRLTLSLGLRYELTKPFTNTLGNYFTVKIPQIDFTPNQPQANWPFFVRQEKGCADPYDGLKIRWTSTNAVCGGGLNNNLRETKNLNFAPRIGIAYSFDDKTVIRAGFGIFYMEDIANAEYFDMARNIAARVDLTTTPATPITWNNSIPGGSGTIVQVPPPFAWAAAYDHATPYTMQYLVNVQRELSANWVVEIGYLGSQSRHLYGFQNINQAAPGPLNSINSRRPYANFGVLSFVSDAFKGSYNAGSAKITRRFSQGISLTTNYTYAKSIDNASGTRTQGFDTLFPQDSSCLECERGLSSFDVRHRWVLGAVYELPIGKGKLLGFDNAVANAFIGGWQLSTNSTIQSGVPMTLTTGINNAGTNNPLPDRPSFSGVGTGYLSTPTPTSQGLRWFDPASFIVSPQGTFGNVGRNTMITPHFQSIDMALAKRFTMPYSEHHSVQLRLEAFNVFNHPSWGAPNANILAGTSFPGAPSNAAHQGFGIISTTAIPMRQLQLGIKYSF